MAIELLPRIYIGSADDCLPGLNLTPGKAVVHACKSPCHQRIVGYTKSLPTDHPNYLSFEASGDLFLNIIDPPVPLFKRESFLVFRKFATQKYTNGDTLLIHCNQGLSRAPSLGLYFLAKQLQAIADESYDKARAEFEVIFPSFAPGKGIEVYMQEHWEEI